jgi:hypothetical protein
VLRPLLHLVARLVERDPITDDTRFALTPAGEIVADLMRDDARDPRRREPLLRPGSAARRARNHRASEDA